MKRISCVAIVAVMFMMGITSSAQVVQNENQLVGSWRITLSEDQSILLNLSEENGGHMAFAITDDDEAGVILVSMECRWVFSGDILAFMPNPETVKLEYFGEDATMKSLFSQVTEEQRMSLAESLLEEETSIFRFQFLREENKDYVVKRIEEIDTEEGDDEDDDSGEENGEETDEEDANKEFWMTRVAGK